MCHSLPLTETNNRITGYNFHHNPRTWVLLFAGSGWTAWSLWSVPSQTCVTRGVWIWAGESNERLTTPACASQGVPSLDGYPWLPATSGEKMVCSWQTSQVVRVCQVHKSIQDPSWWTKLPRGEAGGKGVQRGKWLVIAQRLRGWGSEKLESSCWNYALKDE